MMGLTRQQTAGDSTEWPTQRDRPVAHSHHTVVERKRSKFPRSASALTAAMVALFGLACSDDPPSREWTEGTDRFVILPDTQCYSRFYPEIFDSQGDLLSTLVPRSGALHGVHVGDITDLNTDDEWSVARAALADHAVASRLTLVTGNHDLGSGGSAVDRTSGIDTFFGDLRPDFVFDGSVQNSASLVGDSWIVVGLEFAPRPDVTEWANGIIAAHPDRYAMVVTHAYLFDDGERYDIDSSTEQAYHPHQYPIGGEGLDGQGLWEALGRRHANLRFIVSGHVPGMYAVSPTRGDAGNLVWEIVVDFQDVPCSPTGDDGQGYLLVLDLGDTDVDAVVYSPWLNSTLDEQSLELESL